MKLIYVLPLLYSCSQVSVRSIPEEEKLVSVQAALVQAKASYLKGCVDAHRSLKLGPSFPYCEEQSKFHYDELKYIMKQVPGDSER
jgi:hypothetical protein